MVQNGLASIFKPLRCQRFEAFRNTKGGITEVICLLAVGFYWHQFGSEADSSSNDKKSKII